MINNKKNKKYKLGFTLIEISITIAIIGILASVVIVSLSAAKKRAIDAKKMSELKSLQTGLRLFYEMKGRMPKNYHHGYGTCDAIIGENEFAASMQELIDAGIISSVPHSPDSWPYCYYDYGSGNEIGALVVSYLLGSTPSTTGFPGTCRPWAVGLNWCDQTENQGFCLCTPY